MMHAMASGEDKSGSVSGGVSSLADSFHREPDFGLATNTRFHRLDDSRLLTI